jgi:RNA polymerase sigma-70 factor (ECF subfamily)
MDESMSTRVLVQKFQDGDQAALDELFQRYYPRVLASVRLRLGSGLRKKEQSMDIVQDVMLEAFQRIGTIKFASDGDFMRYLRQVVLHEICDKADFWEAAKRNRKKEVPLKNDRSSMSGNPLNTKAICSDLTPSKIFSRLEDMAVMEKAMDRLAEKSLESRDLFVDVAIEGRSYAEIAAEAGSTPDAIRMRFARAKEALKLILKSLTKDK